MKDVLVILACDHTQNTYALVTVGKSGDSRGHLKEVLVVSGATRCPRGSKWALMITPDPEVSKLVLHLKPD